MFLLMCCMHFEMLQIVQLIFFGGHSFVLHMIYEYNSLNSLVVENVSRFGASNKYLNQ